MALLPSVSVAGIIRLVFPSGFHCLVMQGEMVLQQPWFNLSCQSPQPSLRAPIVSYNPFSNAFQDASSTANQPPLSASLCSELAFQLGSCLKVEGAIDHPIECLLMRTSCTVASMPSIDLQEALFPIACDAFHQQRMESVI